MGAIAMILGLALAGCGGRAARVWISTPGPFDRIEPEQLDRVAEARARIEAGELEQARVVLAALVEELPLNLAVARMLQDVQLALLEQGHSLPGLPIAAPPEDASALLASLYAPHAGTEPTAVDLVLEARLQPDSDRALELLDRAVALDPGCIWAHYGRAHHLARKREVGAALEALERALELDSGHLPSRRLETILLLRRNESATAVLALEAWLADSAGDPRVDPSERAQARLDLAALHLRRGEPDDALEQLEAIEPERLPAPAELGIVRAAADEARGEPALALEAVAFARAVDPTDPLPVVQAAMIHEYVLGEPARAAELWAEVVELARARAIGSVSEGAAESGSRSPNAGAAVGTTAAAAEPVPIDLAALLLWAQARVRVERFERAQASAAAAPDVSEGARRPAGASP